MFPFKEIYEKYYRMVYSLSYKYLGNAEDAEEITQDVFVKVYFALDKFKGNSSVKTWIFRICVNACLEHLKKKKRQKRFGFLIPLINEETGKENTGKTDSPDAHESMENKELNKELTELIHSLPENQKTAFLLFKMEDLSYKEIAEIMDTTDSAVESLLSRARANLKKEIEKKFPSRRKN